MVISNSEGLYPYPTYCVVQMEIVADNVREVQREYSDNIMEDFVEYSRSQQVLNEEQALGVLYIYLSGLLPDHSDYCAGFITGGSSGGKTHMKEKVIDKAFSLRDNEEDQWLFKTTSTSAKGLIDDPLWDASRIAAMNELNKIPEDMLEFLKSVHGDDGGHDYTRNQPDKESDSGFSSVHVESEAKPVIFMLADENKMVVESELDTRMFEIKVDETREKNAAVHDMHWGHENLVVDGVDHEYIWNDPELEYAIQRHIADIPVDTPVLLPTGQGRFDGDDWNASEVMKPMFTFDRSESTRASRMVSSMVKASALGNYHQRDTVMWENHEDELVEHIVAEPQDVGNLIGIRRVLLTTTHGLDEKKMAVLDAIIEKGGQANREGTALQATKKDIQDHIQQNPRVSTLNKSQLKSVLEDMNENYLIDIQENPEDRREYLYVYDGADALGRPNVQMYPEKFSDVTDPIRNCPIQTTIKKQQESLGAKNPSDVLDVEVEEQVEIGGDMSDLEDEVLSLLGDTLDGKDVLAEDLESMEWEHMTGAAPLDESGGTVKAAGTPTNDSKAGTIFDPNHDLWNGHTAGQARSKIEQTITSLQQTGRWRLDDNDDGTYTVTVVA